MKKVIKSTAWNVVYSILCMGAFLLLSSCFFRPIDGDASPNEPDGVFHVVVRWGKYVRPEGEWLIFYPENRSLKPFSREIADDNYIDDLQPGAYKLLLLGMDKTDPKVQFCDMDDSGCAMLKLMEAGSAGDISHPEIIYACTATCNFTQESGQMVMFSPYPLSLRTCFEMPIAVGKKVKSATAHLTGLVNSVKLFTMEVGYAPTGHYSELNTVFHEDRVSFEGKMLLPVLGKTRGEGNDSFGKTFLEMSFEYEDGEVEEIKTDITQTIQEVVVEAPVEVTVNLLKIGTTATVVSWVAGTGSGEVN